MEEQLSELYATFLVNDMPFFVVRTIKGREDLCAELIASKVKLRNLPVKAILATPKTPGYVYVEADSPFIVNKAIQGVKLVRGMFPTAIDENEVLRLVKEEPLLERLKVGDKIEVVSGPFTGYRGKVLNIYKRKREVEVLLEGTESFMPIKLRDTQLNLVSE